MTADLTIHSMVARVEHPARMRQVARAELVAAAAAVAPRRGLRRTLAGLAAAGLLSLALAGGAAAHEGHEGLNDDAAPSAGNGDAVASAGNGGVAVGEADGGVALLGDVTGGLNGANAIRVGDVWDGSVAVDGGDVSAATTIGVSADGGVAVTDASGGDGNTAIAADDRD